MVNLSALLEQAGAFFHKADPAIKLNVISASGIDNSLVGKYLDPVEYCEKVLHVTTLTDEQKQIMRLTNKPPYRILVPSGHSCGKSYMAACLTSWWFDTFKPSIVLTTSVTERQVKDILWKEVRALRAAAGLGGFIGPREPRMETGPDHYAQGFTARDENAFQGHHGPHMLIIFDEAQGIAPGFWEAVRTMLTGVKWAFLAIYNPVGQGCRVFKEESAAGYHPPVRMSCLNHPNVIAELQGLPRPIPSAISLETVRMMLTDWATPIQEQFKGPDDILFDGQWWQLGPIADARIAGRWPRQAINSVWPVSLFDECCQRKLIDGGKLQVGVDVARYGDDDSVIFVRKGGAALHWEKHNGWNTVQVAERAMAMCSEFAYKYRIEVPRGPKSVPVAVDDTGVGGGVTDVGQRAGYMFVPVNSSNAIEALEEKFDNLRSALWFGVVDMARKGDISFARLPKHAQDILRDECCAQKYELDTRARRVVWSKKQMKKETDGHSPDSADAMNLAWLDLAYAKERVAYNVQVPK